MRRRRHDNPHAERRIREYGLLGWLSESQRDAQAEVREEREAAAAAERKAAVAARILVLNELAGDESATPLAREAARRAALALEVPESLSVAEYAFQELVKDRVAYAAWVATVLNERKSR